MTSNKLKERFACILVYSSAIPPGEEIPWAQKWVQEHPGEVDWWDEVEKFTMNYPSCNFSRVYDHLALFFISQRELEIAQKFANESEAIDWKLGYTTGVWTLLKMLIEKMQRSEPIDPKWFERELSAAFSIKTDDIRYKELLETYRTLYDYVKEQTGKDDREFRKGILMAGLDWIYQLPHPEHWGHPSCKENVDYLELQFQKSQKKQQAKEARRSRRNQLTERHFSGRP